MGLSNQNTSNILTIKSDYYPFGSLKPSRNASASNYRFGFNGQEGTDELSGVGNHTTATFWEYDTRLGRRWNLDPVDQISISNYAVFKNNPIIYTDPDGDSPWLIGALVGAVTDITIQGLEIYLDDKKNYSKDFSWTSVGVSAGAGATGVGLATKLKKATTLVKFATSATVDGAASAGTQLAKEGKVDAGDVFIDVAAGQMVGGFVENVLDAKFLKSKQGKYLQEQVNQQKNAAGGKSNAIPKAKANVKGAEQTLTNAQKSRSAGAAVSSSQAGSIIGEKVKEKITKGDK